MIELEALKYPVSRSSKICVLRAHAPQDRSISTRMLRDSIAEAVCDEGL